MLITIALFSFKNEAPKKEYMTLRLETQPLAWIITKPDLTETKLNYKTENYVNIINGIASEGWELKSANGSVTVFERVKQ